jgi:hypothetical protein
MTYQIFFKNMFDNKDVKLGSKVIPLERIKGLRSYRIGNLLLIEQNPKKESEYAKSTRGGAQIMWVVDTKINKYLYRIQDGKLFKL